ncbi:MAG: flavin reductase family protein [Bacteroidota bacterium]
MSEFTSFDPYELPQKERHGYLLTAVAPRPIAFASTVDTEGNVNLSPFSYFNVFSTNPPVVVFSPTRRGRDNTTKDTHNNLLQVKETVISIVNYPMVEQMSLSSTAYDKGVNEFVKAGFTQIASDKVKPPRVGEAPVSFECVVDDMIELGDEGGAGTLVVCRVVQIHLRNEYLDEEGKLDPLKLNLVGRMGGIWYTKTNQDSMFEIPKPLRKKGIGVDQLPEAIRNSAVLTGNNLGRLANIEQLPTQEEIQLTLVETNLNRSLDKLAQLPENERLPSRHFLAQEVLEAGDIMGAWAVLLS